MPISFAAQRKGMVKRVKHYLTPSAKLIFTNADDFIATSVQFGDLGDMDGNTIFGGSISWSGDN